MPGDSAILLEEDLMPSGHDRHSPGVRVEWDGDRDRRGGQLRQPPVWSDSEGVQGISATGRDLAHGPHVDDEEEAPGRIELEVPRKAQSAEHHLLNLARMHWVLFDLEHRDVLAPGVARVEPRAVAVDLR